MARAKSKPPKSPRNKSAAPSADGPLPDISFEADLWDAAAQGKQVERAQVGSGSDDELEAESDDD